MPSKQEESKANRSNKQSAKLPNIVLEEALQKDGNEVQKESKANHCDCASPW